jgi:hypothetical protein
VDDQNFSGSLMADQEMMLEGIIENERVLEEAITIKLFSNQSSAPGAFGTQKKITFTDFPATAVLVDLGIAASMFKEGVLTAGDIVLHMRERLTESNEHIGGNHPGDRVIWRGSEYRLVQRPIPVLLNDVMFYDVLLRRTNSQQDVTGL